MRASPRGADDEGYPGALGRLLTGRALTRVLVGLTLVGALLSWVFPIVVPGSPYFFSVASEMGAWAFLSVGIFLMGAAAHAFAGLLATAHDRRLSLAFATTSLILLALAFDDFVGLHERLGGLGGLIDADLPFHLGYLWVLPGLAVAGVCAYGFWTLVRRLSGPPRRDLVAGLILFFGAALGIESVNGLLDDAGARAGLVLLGTHIEEVVENLGAILLLRGALRTIAVAGISPLVARFATETLLQPRRGFVHGQNSRAEQADAPATEVRRPVA